MSFFMLSLLFAQITPPPPTTNHITLPGSTNSFTPSEPTVYHLRFCYDTNLNPDLYTWEVQTSTNLTSTNWTHFSDATNVCIHFWIDPSEPQRYFRVMGTPK